MSPDARLLLALRSSAAPVPLAELAAQAGLTPEAATARFIELEAAGYEIARHPHLGCQLLAAPDRLIADDLAASLAAAGVERLAREIIVFEETASTNDVAHRLGRAGAAEGALIFAERQSAGRGRLGRKWESAPRAGLWFSLLLRPRLPLAEWPRLTTWAAVGIARGLDTLGLKAEIKWPNDIYLAGRKTAGILIESAAEPGGGGFAVVGIGLNVNQSEFPADLARTATSLRLAGPGEPLERRAVAVALLTALETAYPLVTDAFPTLLAEAETRSLLIGRWVEVRTPTGPLRGMAEGLEADGSLRLRSEDGQTHTLAGGEVSIAHWG